MMASDEWTKAIWRLPPPPAPAARLLKLPSNADIICSHNADVSLLILRAVLIRGAHCPGPGGTYHLPTTSQLSCERTRLSSPALSLAGSRNGPYTSSEKYEGECLHHHRALFRVQARCSSTPHSAAAIGIAAPQQFPRVEIIKNKNVRIAG